MHHALLTHLQQQLQQLNAVLGSITQAQYVQPVALLSGATIGQHCRHIIELIQCLEQGYATGVVNYDARRRDILLQTELQVCRQSITAFENIPHYTDKPLTVEGLSGNDIIRVPSSWYRELLYNVEHATHHMALIRVALLHFGIAEIPSHFGYAPSTIKYQQQCAQ